jgi:glycosyltransferase involved in cell wall biosynthesis
MVDERAGAARLFEKVLVVLALLAAVADLAVEHWFLRGIHKESLFVAAAVFLGGSIYFALERFLGEGSSRRILLHVLRPLARFGTGDGPRPWPRSLAAAVLILLASLPLAPSALVLPTTLSEWGVHTAISFEIAINHVAFGLPSHVDRRVCDFFRLTNDPTLGFEQAFQATRGSMNDFLRRDPRALSLPALSLPELTAGTVPAHLAQLEPYAHNENTIVWFSEALLNLAPGLSVGDILFVFNLVRIACLAAFVLLLVRAGASPLFTWASVLCAEQLLGELNAVPPLVGVCASLVPALLGTIAGLGLLLSAGAHRRPAIGAIALFLAGMGLFLVANLRTSYTPVLIVLTGIYLAAVAQDLGRGPAVSTPRRALRVGVFVLALVGGWLTLDRALLAPIRELPAEVGMNHHGISHPLVLSLAVPDNELAREEGILWDDFRGVVLARRIDPKANYLTPEYEAAMFTYYRNLWRDRPGDMLRVYLQKADSAGASALAAVRESEWTPAGETLIHVGVEPLFWVRWGLVFLGLWLSVLALGVRGSWRRAWTDEAGFALTAVAATIVLLYVESAIIYSVFTLQYHAFLVFGSASLGWLAIALVLDRGTRATPVEAEAAPPPKAGNGLERRVTTGRSMTSEPEKAPSPQGPLPLVSVVAPVYNEADAIDEFMERVLVVADGLAKEYRFELVLVNDGSRDGSLEIMKARAARDPRVRVVELCRNYGQTAALQAGFDAARGSLLVTLDADLQHFPEEIPQFLQKLEAEDWDVVCGWRHERKEGIKRRLPSRIANALIRRISGLEIHDMGTTFRAYRGDTARRLRLYGDAHRFIPVLAAWNGGRVTELPIQNVDRPFGKSNYGISRTFGVLLDLILLHFLLHYLDRPMRAFGKLGFAIFTMGAGIIATLLVISFVQGVATVRERSGWFLMAIMLILTSVQLVLTGILAELVIRIHFSHSDQRTYAVRQEWPRPSGDPSAGT